MSINTNHPWDEYDDDLEEVIKIKRLIVDIPMDMHIEVKKRAAIRGISIKKYVLKAIIERIKKERSLGEL